MSKRRFDSVEHDSDGRVHDGVTAGVECPPRPVKRARLHGPIDDSTPHINHKRRPESTASCSRARRARLRHLIRQAAASLRLPTTTSPMTTTHPDSHVTTLTPAVLSPPTSIETSSLSSFASAAAAGDAPVHHSQQQPMPASQAPKRSLAETSFANDDQGLLLPPRSPKRSRTSPTPTSAANNNTTKPPSPLRASRPSGRSRRKPWYDTDKWVLVSGSLYPRYPADAPDADIRPGHPHWVRPKFGTPAWHRMRLNWPVASHEADPRKLQEECIKIRENMLHNRIPSPGPEEGEDDPMDELVEEYGLHPIAMGLYEGNDKRLIEVFGEVYAQKHIRIRDQIKYNPRHRVPLPPLTAEELSDLEPTTTSTTTTTPVVDTPAIDSMGINLSMPSQAQTRSPSRKRKFEDDADTENPSSSFQAEDLPADKRRKTESTVAAGESTPLGTANGIGNSTTPVAPPVPLSNNHNSTATPVAEPLATEKEFKKPSRPKKRTEVVPAPTRVLRRNQSAAVFFELDQSGKSRKLV